MNKPWIFVGLLFFLLSGCKDDDPTQITEEAESFLNEVVSVMEANSVNRKKIDWVDFRQQVFEKAGAAQSITDTYPGIRQALILLGDNHSSFRGGDGTVIFAGTLQCETETINTPDLPATVGYVKVSFFSGDSNSSAAQVFAETIQNNIKEQDSSDIIGWIVDLRNNTGGNMYPMIAGIGSILGEGTAGYFIDPDNNEVPWGFKNGASVYNGSPFTTMSDPYQLIAPNPRVAVLLNGAVASSGEVMAISFIGREDTKSFGSPTCGLSTGNSYFSLSDGSALILTTSLQADRNKNAYGTPIEPDVVVSNANIIAEAIAWLESE